MSTITAIIFGISLAMNFVLFITVGHAGQQIKEEKRLYDISVKDRIQRHEEAENWQATATKYKILYYNLLNEQNNDLQFGDEESRNA